MSRLTKCTVQGCTNHAHARGYCRRHYGQIWRRGIVYTESAERPYNNNNIRREDSERLRAIEKELSRAREMYNGVIGIAGRIRWKKEVEMLEVQFHDLMSKLGELAPELRSKDNSHDN